MFTYISRTLWSSNNPGVIQPDFVYPNWIFGSRWNKLQRASANSFDFIQGPCKQINWMTWLGIVESSLANLNQTFSD